MTIKVLYLKFIYITIKRSILFTNHSCCGHHLSQQSLSNYAYFIYKSFQITYMSFMHFLVELFNQTPH